MNLRSFQEQARYLRQTPFPMVLDKMGLMRHPYRVSARKGLTVELRPGVLGERYVFYEVFMKSCYFSVGQRLRPGDTVIDIGANVGFFSVLAASIVGPTGLVIAIEPAAETFAQLQRNIQVSGMKNIRARRMAVTEKKGTCTLFFGDVPAFSSVFSSVDDKPADLRSQEVTATTLADIMNDEGIAHCNYLKMDCEGAEYGIVDSLPPEVARRIDQITMEVHNIPGKDSSKLDRQLQDAGFRALLRGKLSAYVREPQ